MLTLHLVRCLRSEIVRKVTRRRIVANRFVRGILYDCLVKTFANWERLIHHTLVDNQQSQSRVSICLQTVNSRFDSGALLFRIVSAARVLDS